MKDSNQLAEMSSIAELVGTLRERGAQLSADGDQLRISAPVGVINARFQTLIRERKQELLQWLKADVAPEGAGDAAFFLSPAQEGLWIFQELHQDSTAYNHTPVVQIDGPLQVQALIDAIVRVLKRHEPLRSVIDDTPRGPAFRPVPVTRDVLRLVDLSKMEEASKDGAVQAEVQIAQAQPFDLRRDIPFRAVLVRHGVESHVLITTFHHIAADGMSLRNFYHDLATFYHGREPAPLRASYRDYARSERSYWTDDRAADRLSFWRAELGAAPHSLELPADRPRTTDRSYTGGMLSVTLGSEILKGLEKLMHAEGASLFMTTLAAYAAALHRNTGQQNLVIGTPLHGRDKPEYADLIGMFVNQLPLPMRIDAGTSFRDLVRQSRATVLRTLADRELPFGRLVEGLGIARDQGRSPLFQAVLNVVPSFDVWSGIGTGDVAFRLPDTREMLALFDGQSKFDLTLYPLERDGEVSLVLVYNADLFSAERMKDILATVEDVLIAGAAEPDGVLHERWKASIPARHGGIAGPDSSPDDELIVSRFTRIAKAHPERPALIDDAGATTYAALHDEARRIARLIRTHTTDASRPVAVFLPHEASVGSAILGVLFSGRPYVPLDASYPTDRLQYMLADSGADLILTTPLLRQRAGEIANASAQVITVADVAPQDAPELSDVPPDAVAYMLYTSGSTGLPKAVVQSHRNLLVQAERYARVLKIGPGDRLALTASISFDAHLMDLFGGLLSGASVHTIDLRSTDLSQLPRLAGEAGITVLHVTPTVFRTLARTTSGQTWPTIRAVALGGEPVRAEGVAYFDQAFRPDAVLLNLYGASEHSFSIGDLIDRTIRREEVPIGAPLGDVEVLFFDAEGNENPITGEIVLRSRHHALGYWLASEHAARAFVPDPLHPGRILYRTGDLGRLGADGRIIAMGRVDNQMKVRGHRIEPNEIESLLREHPLILDAAVHAPEIGNGDRVLTACCIARGGASFDVRDLSAWCARRLPSYMVPTEWVAVDALPRTPSGKVDRLSLPRHSNAGLASWEGDSNEERSAEEEILHQICMDVLGHDLGIHDDFFHAGGHSLSATQVVARVREMLEVNLPLRQFFEHPTVAETADWIRMNRGNSVPVPPLVRHEALDDRAPLSFAQERMWLIQKLAPESAAYNMGGAVLIEGAFDVERFRTAVDIVAQRQESLRTSFPMHGGVPFQSVHPVSHDFEFKDLRAVPEAERLHRAESAVTDMIEARYDLEHGPLFRVLVVRVGPGRHVIAIGMHHIISDLWSFGVLGREIAAAYANPDAPRPGLPVRYRDFSLWQREWLRDGILAKEIEYWRQRLAGVAALELPTDMPRPAFFTFDGAVVHAPLSPVLSSAIKTLSTASKATPFMATLAAFNALLSAHSGQSDIAVGVPIANRTQPASEKMIGTFVNTLVHRNDLSGDPTFRELLRRVRTNALDAFAHQDVPFDLLVKELQPARDTSRPPFFQVLFNVANAPVHGTGVANLKSTVLPIGRRTAQFDLTMNVALNAMQSAVSLSYNTALFTKDTAERLLRQYLEMLERAVANPDIRLSELQRVSGSERKLLVENWNATQREYPTDARLLSLFAAQAQTQPARIAVESPTGGFTYGELLDYAQRVTAALQQIGVKPGDRVAILMQRSREMLGALLGILGSGASYVPVDPNYPEARVRYMLEDSGAVAVVTHRGLEHEYQISVNVLDVDRWTPPPPVAFLETTRDQAAYLIYTSGSTGKPKGVEVPHGAVANFLLGMQERPGLRPDDALLAVTTISFDIAVLELYLPLIAGARVVMVGEEEALDGRRLLQRIEEADITVMQATPATWKLLLAAGWEGKPDLRVLCGGEPLSRALADALLDRTAELWNMYGPTETTVWSTVDRIERAAPILIGRPIANTTLYVLREGLEPVPIGVPGELYIGGAGVANGYVNRPDLTAERFIADPFRPGERMYGTGDLVRYRADGRVEHLGRLDHQVKVRGFRIELGEIESALRAHDGIRDVAVTAADDRLVAYIVARNESLPPAGELRRLLSASLPQYMLPSVFVPLDELPLTPNGKIDRKRLPAPAPETRTTERKLPSQPLERAIAEVWATLLGVDEIGVSDNFFELGGHSLLAMQAVAQIEERTGVRVEPRSLFFRTLGELAESSDLVPEELNQ